MQPGAEDPVLDLKKQAEQDGGRQRSACADGMAAIWD
jgi:hypothetical protein